MFSKQINRWLRANNVVEHYRLSEEQKGNTLMAFGAEPEADQYGIANAVTRAVAEGGWLGKKPGDGESGRQADHACQGGIQKRG